MALIRNIVTLVDLLSSTNKFESVINNFMHEKSAFDE